VGNILGLKRPATAQALLQAMIDLELEDVAAVHYLNDIYQLMQKYRVTFYDAAYHGLAIARKGHLVTADAAYVRKTQAAGHAVLLSQWRHTMQ
jgi:predicted nucleic acid-binding protein